MINGGTILYPIFFSFLLYTKELFRIARHNEHVKSHVDVKSIVFNLVLTSNLSISLKIDKF